MSRLTVVKVGGSLYDLPDLGERLRSFLAALDTATALLVPGGGPLVDAIRALDGTHRLGEEAAHWLALRALTLNAYFLNGLLPGAVVAKRPTDRHPLAILDPHAFARDDESRPGCLPHRWEVASDAIAARAAVVAGAQRLILLKSVTIPKALSWDEAERQGFVDGWLPRVLERMAAGLQVEAMNLRSARITER